MSSLPHLHTPRLILVAILPSSLRLSNSDLWRHLAAEVPATWPPEHWEPHALDFFDKQYLQAPRSIAWNRYVIVRAPTPVVIGAMGGFPKSANEVEIGYSLLEPWQGQGLATEALVALLKVIFNDSSVHSICAQTLPHLLPSLRILEKCGFKPVGRGEGEGSLLFRLQREDWANANG